MKQCFRHQHHDDRQEDLLDLDQGALWGQVIGPCRCRVELVEVVGDEDEESNSVDEQGEDVDRLSLVQSLAIVKVIYIDRGFEIFTVFDEADDFLEAVTRQESRQVLARELVRDENWNLSVHFAATRFEVGHRGHLEYVEVSHLDLGLGHRNN